MCFSSFCKIKPLKLSGLIVAPFFIPVENRSKDCQDKISVICKDMIHFKEDTGVSFREVTTLAEGPCDKLERINPLPDKGSFLETDNPQSNRYFNQFDNFRSRLAAVLIVLRGPFPTAYLVICRDKKN